MASVLGALEGEDARRGCAVLCEEVGLHLALREVLEENARANLLAQPLDQGHSPGLVIAVAQVLLLDELVVVDQLHVGALAESPAQRGLSGGLGADDAGDLRKHGLSRVCIDVQNVSVRVNSSDLAELLVVVDHGHVLVEVGVETLLNSLNVVVRAALVAAQQALLARLHRTVEEEHVLGLADMSLEIGALLNSSGEAVNEVVLEDRRAKFD